MRDDTTRTRGRPPLSELGGDVDGREPELPRAIDRFDVVGRLGAGGMGCVFEAYDPKLGRKVAVKHLHPHWDVDDAATRRLLREARALAKLSHPNVVEVYDVGMEKGRVWLAMELVEGQTLRAWARTNPPGTRAQRDAALELLRQAAAGLGAAHAAAMTHRDFKPANVLIGDDGRVRVVDFGLARSVLDPRGEPVEDHLRNVSDASVGSSEQTVTRPGAVVGTPRYMAPEQHRGEICTARTDLFGFAVTAWELLHGETPFDASSMDSLYNAIVSRRFSRRRADAVPRWMTRVLKRALSARPWWRYPSVEALVRALDSRRRRRRMVMVSSVAAVVAMGVASFGVLGGGRENAQGAKDCVEAGAEEFGRVWNEGIRTSIVSALNETGVPYGRTAVRTLESRVERYRQDWTSTLEQACLAEGTAALSAYDCLYSDLQSLSGVLQGMRTMTAADVERIGSSVRGLLSPIRCADVEGSLWGGSRNDALEDLLTAAEVALARREWESAERLAQRVLDEVDESAWRTRLDALVVAGGARIQTRWPDGLGELEEAYRLASAHRADSAAAAAAWKVALGRSQQGDRHISGLWVSRFESASSSLPSSPYFSAVALRCEVLERHGDFAEAVSVCERAVSEASLTNDRALHRSRASVLATVYRRLGRVHDAARISQMLYETVLEDLGPEHPMTGGMLLNLGLSHSALGEFDEAARCALRARGVFRRAYGENSRWVISALMNEAHAHGSQHRLEMAADLLEQAILRFEGVDPLQQARVLNNLSSVRSDQGRYQDALELLARVDAIESTELESDATARGVTHEGRAWVYFGLGRWREGVEAASAAIAIRERSGEKGSLIASLAARIHGYRFLGKFEEAHQDVQRGIELAADEALPMNTRALPTLLAAILAFDVATAEETERALDRAARAYSGVETSESEHALIAFLRARLAFADPRRRRQAIGEALAAFEVYERRPLLSYPPSEAKVWLDSVH